MKSIGVVRKIDPLGRITLPKETRTMLGVNVGDPMEIFVSEDTVMLRKYEPFCVFCGSGENVKEFRGKKVCQECSLAI